MNVVKYLNYRDDDKGETFCMVKEPSLASVPQDHFMPVTDWQFLKHKNLPLNYYFFVIECASSGEV